MAINVNSTIPSAYAMAINVNSTNPSAYAIADRDSLASTNSTTLEYHTTNTDSVAELCSS